MLVGAPAIGRGAAPGAGFGRAGSAHRGSDRPDRRHRRQRVGGIRRLLSDRRRIRSERPAGISLAKLYRAASGDSTVVIDLGTAAFFSNPSGIGTRVVDRTIRAKPDLTFAIDYLFWFTYGTIGVESRRIRTDEDRMALLEVGLAQLDRIEGPVLVGDIPDMSSAAGRVMMKSQVAPEDVRLRANERIREWASSRPNVRVFPLGDLIERLRSGEAFNIGPHAWTAAEAGTLILGDRLHPSLDGLIALVIAIDDLLANDPELAAIRPDVETDRARLKRRLTGATAEADLDRLITLIRG